MSVLAVLFGAIMPPALVHAQATTTRPPLSLTTSPIPLSIITRPGQTVTADLRVKNNSTQSETLKIELLKFGANGQSGNPQLREREPKDTYFDWVSFSEDSFVAEPNVWKTIKMTIKAPPEAAFGYYFAVLFSRANPTKPTGGNSGVEGGVASLVLLDVEAPGAKRTVEVARLTATRKVYEFLPAELSITLKNTGNIHVAPAGSVFLKRGSTQIGRPLDFNTQRGNILPGTSRDFTVKWNDGFPVYTSKVVGTKTIKHLEWDFGKLQKFRIGRYSATLVAVYDDGTRDIPVEGTVSFWVIPWRILGGIFLIMLFVGFGLWMMLRSVWRGVRRTAKPDKPSKKTKPGEDSAEPAANDQPLDEDSETVSDQGEPAPENAAGTDPEPSQKPPSKSALTDSGTTAPKTAPELKD